MILKGFGFVTFFAGVKATFISFFEANKSTKCQVKEAKKTFYISLLEGCAVIWICN